MSESFDDLVKRIKTAGRADPGTLSNVFREAGLTPEKGTQVRDLLNQMGISNQQMASKDQIISLVQGMTAQMPAELRQQFANLASQIIKDMGGGEIPDDIAAFLSKWQGNGN